MTLAVLLELNHWDLNHPLSGNGYQSWSGIISDVGEIALVGGMITLVLGAWRHLECGAPGCHRPGRHHYLDKDGKRHQLCHKHDVDEHPKAHWWTGRQGHSLAEIHRRIRS